MPNKIIPNSYNGWDPLKQVILGNCYTPDFFDEIKDHKLRHLLQKLLYETQEDLLGFKNALEEAGVEVLQLPSNISCANVNDPTENVNELFELRQDAWYSWLTTRGGIPKPWIAPRDRLITYGDKLSVTGADFGNIKFLLDNWIDAENLDTKLADEFTPDGCRLWDSETLKEMDKDRFRQGLGDVVESYHQVADRLGMNIIVD